MGEKPEGEAPAAPVATPAAEPATATAEPTTPVEPTTPAEPAEPKAEPEPAKAETPAETAETQAEPATEGQPKKKENGWIKFLRIVIWVAVAICITAGQSLIQTSKLSKAYANGSHSELLGTGNTLFYFGLVIGIANLIWGVTRWILRYKREKWSIGKIIGKLIGGGIWRTLAITPVIIFAAAIIAPRLCNNIETSIINEQEKYTTASDKIIADYEAGKISANDYAKYRFAAAFDAGNLPDEYKSSQLELSPIDDLINFISEHPDEVDDDTKQKLIDVIGLNKVKFGTPQEAQKAAKIQDDAKKAQFFGRPAYAEKNTDVSILSEAVLSGSGKFIVFYTEYGDDKITADTAKEIASQLDQAVENYKKNLGLDYIYDRVIIHDDEYEDMQDVLIRNGIPKSAAETAMPVYVTSPYSKENTIFAYYLKIHNTSDIGIRIGIWRSDDEEDKNERRLRFSIPSLPYIVIIPNKLSEPGKHLVVAHELGHHYDDRYCVKKFGETYSTEDFVVETLANFSAVTAYKNQPDPDNLLNNSHFNKKYLGKSTNDRLDSYSGYWSFSFLLNYAEIVPNARDIIYDASHETTALQYLYDKAGEENFKKAMHQTTTRNVTGYDPKYSINVKTPLIVEDNPCTEVCTVTKKMEAASSRYYYFSSEEFQNIWVEYNNNSHTTATLYGKKGDSYEVIANGDKFSTLFKKEEKDKYELYILAITSYTVKDDDASYSLKLTTKELADLMKVAETETGEPVTDLGDGCIELNMDSLLELPNQLMALGRYLLETLQRKDDSEDYSSAIEQFDLQQKQLRHDTDYTKKQLAGYRISVCETPINTNESDETIKAAIKKSVSGPLQTITINADGQKYNVLIGYNLLTREAKAFAIVREDGQTVLYTLIVQEK